MNHKHKPIKSEEKPFFYCVNSARCVPESHGGITIVATCACGATRLTNVNGWYYERGTWTLKEES